MMIFERYCISYNNDDTVNDAIILFKEKLNQSLYINSNSKSNSNKDSNIANNSEGNNNSEDSNNDNNTNNENNMPLFTVEDIR